MKNLETLNNEQSRDNRNNGHKRHKTNKREKQKHHITTQKAKNKSNTDSAVNPGTYDG